jgi:PAS domain S-box-containing protein
VVSLNRAEVEATFRAVFENALDAVLIIDDDGRILDANRAVTTVLGTPGEELVGEYVGERATLEGRARLAEMWREFGERGSLRAEYEFTAADGSWRSVEFTAVANFLPGRHLTIVRDCTERKRDQQAAERRAAEQAVVADLSLLALGGIDGDGLAEEIVARVTDTLRVESVALLERLPDADELLLRAGVGWPAGAIGHARLRADAGSTLARTLAGGDPIVWEDVPAAARPQDAALLGGHGRVSGVSVAIGADDAPFGVLCAYTRERRSFTAEEVSFLRVVANTAAMAVERERDDLELRRANDEIARLAAERQRIVAEALDAEDRARERISQQLHDRLLQSLLVIRQDLAQVVADPERRELVVRARDGIQEAIRELRAAVFDLHPVVLEQGGLRPSVVAVARHHAALGGFEVAVEVGDDAAGRLDRLVVSLVRELLANVASHAAARRASVTVRRLDDGLLLEVSDDGRGVDPAALPRALVRGHIGLASAAQRVEALGGRFEILGRPDGGTTVRATIPLDET